MAGVLGLGACACPGATFLRPLDARTVRCWPCGALGCDPLTQEQTPCAGLHEPSCACLLPSAAEVSEATQKPSLAHPYIYSELIPHHKQVVPTDRYCSFRCTAGYEPTPQAAFDERARVGSAVAFEGGQGGSQTLDFGGAAVMKQVLPLGERLLLFVSNANQVSAALSNALLAHPPAG